MCGNRVIHGARGAMVVGLIALGAALLWGMGTIWPLWVMAPGLVCLALAYTGGRAAAPFAIPGMIIAGTGGLLFIQNLTGYWASWSYAWTLYGVFLGLGLMLMGALMDAPALIPAGRSLVRTSAIALVVFAAVMELVFGVGGGRGLLPVLVAAGGLVLIARILPGQGKHKIKRKRREDSLFTGPIVVGSRVTRSPNGSRLDELEQAARRPNPPERGA